MTAGAPRPALAFVETAADLGYEGPDLKWYLLTCVLVIGGICVLGLLVRRLLAGTLRARAAKRSLQVLDVLPLGGKQRLLVVRCYDRSFLLGLGDKEVRSIAELDAEEVAAVNGPPAPEIETVHPVRTREDFEELLRRTPRPAKTKPREEQREPRAPRRPVLDGGRGILG